MSMTLQCKKKKKNMETFVTNCLSTLAPKYQNTQIITDTHILSNKCTYEVTVESNYKEIELRQENKISTKAYTH